MTLPQSALDELLGAIRAGDGLDLAREAFRLVAQELIELEASQAIGAGRYERTDERTTHRNGSRSRLLSTKAGDVELHIPKLREGSFFPSLLAPRRRIDRALWAVVMEAYVHGVSTRKVDDLVAALGIEAGVSKSEVSRICGELDATVGAFRERRLDHVRFPYLFLDATYVKAHQGPSVVSKAIVVATGVTATGEREVLGLDVGDSEDGAFWAAFLRSLRARGLGGVRLVVSDAHEGLRGAIGSVLLDAAWQRCRVHFLRNVLARVPRASAQMARGHPDHLRRARRGLLPVAARRGGGQAGTRLPGRGGDAHRRQGGHPRLRRLPGRPLAQGLEHQPARAGEQGDQAAHRRGGHLPQRGGHPAPRGGGAPRGPRRVAGGRPQVPVGGLHGAARRRHRRPRARRRLPARLMRGYRDTTRAPNGRPGPSWAVAPINDDRYGCPIDDPAPVGHHGPHIERGGASEPEP